MRTADATGSYGLLAFGPQLRGRAVVEILIVGQRPRAVRGAVAAESSIAFAPPAMSIVVVVAPWPLR